MPVKIERESTIQQLKDEIVKEHGVHKDTFKLAFGGNDLVNDKHNLSHY